MAVKRDTIFISYRRSDAAGSATAIRKTLLERFGERAVFRDVEGIDAGAVFPETLRGELKRAAVVIAVIGKEWLRAANEWGQRRIDFEDDWITTELSLSLADPDVTVIPTLVEGARMPPESALPQSLKKLAYRNAVTIRDDAWDDTAKRLLDSVAQILKPDDGDLRRQTSEKSMPDLIRQAVAEALESAGQAARQVLLITVDDISRLVASLTTGELDAKGRANLKLLLDRLLGRPVIRVDAYMKEVLRHTFSYATSEGRWLGYSLHSEVGKYETDHEGCVLLLPGPSSDGRPAELRGAAVIEKVNLDYYGASSNEPPGPYASASEPIVEAGHRFGVAK